MQLPARGLLPTPRMTLSKTYLRHLLMSRSEWMEARLHAKAAANGYGDITPSMVRLYAHLGSRPVPLSDLARRLAISRQAVHKMASEGVRAGYVEMLPDAVNARIKLLRFTPRGRQMAESARRELDAIEQQLVDMLGQDRLDTLKAVLAAPWSLEELS